MKNMLESGEVFEAYARIDYCYYRIAKLQKQMNKPRSPIEMAVDQACGYNPIKEITKELIDLLKKVIESKKFIDDDYSGAQEALNKTLELYEKT